MMKIASEYDCNNDEDTLQNSVNLMNVMREYPTKCDRKSKDFKDESKKANVWKDVASRAKLEVSKVMAQSNTIRTAFFPPFFTISRDEAELSNHAYGKQNRKRNRKK